MRSFAQTQHSEPPPPTSIRPKTRGSLEKISGLVVRTSDLSVILAERERESKPKQATFRHFLLDVRPALHNHAHTIIHVGRGGGHLAGIVAAVHPVGVAVMTAAGKYPARKHIRREYIRHSYERTIRSKEGRNLEGRRRRAQRLRYETQLRKSSRCGTAVRETGKKERRKSAIADSVLFYI